MTQTPADIAHWTASAADWIRWARAENHDAYWAYEPAFRRFVGPGTGTGLEVGAGEGRVSRMLSGLGYRMTLADPTPPLLKAARHAHSGVHYVLAPGNALPLPANSFDLVTLYNVLMDVDDLTGTLAEATRVLAPGGTMVIGITHPFNDLAVSLRRTGEWGGKGAYFDARPFDDAPTDRNGLRMHFRAGCALCPTTSTRLRPKT